jgi:hypothetical protein
MNDIQMVQLANRVEHAKKRKENGRQFLISRFTPSLLPPKILKKKKKKKKKKVPLPLDDRESSPDTVV